jgi:ZIP family zinc transporter
MISVVALLLALGTFFSTSAGGLFALRYRDRLHLLLGLSAGVILSVVAFDVLPEIDRLAHQTGTGFQVPMLALAVGFLAFHVVEKVLLLHAAHEHEYGLHTHPAVGKASALALAGHSLTDGIAIGLGFQVDSTVGIAVALAIIAHDFADGLNTVSLLLTHRNRRGTALKFLLLDAITPLLGAALTLLVHVPPTGLLVYLGVFAGFLLYIGASDVLPEAHADHPSAATLGLTVLGAAAMYGVLHAIG